MARAHYQGGKNSVSPPENEGLSQGKQFGLTGDSLYLLYCSEIPNLKMDGWMDPCTKATGGDEAISTSRAPGRIVHSLTVDSTCADIGNPRLERGPCSGPDNLGESGPSIQTIRRCVCSGQPFLPRIYLGLRAGTVENKKPPLSKTWRAGTGAGAGRVSTGVRGRACLSLLGVGGLHPGTGGVGTWST